MTTWLKVCALVAVGVAATLWWWPSGGAPIVPRDPAAVGVTAVAAERAAMVEVAPPAANGGQREAAAPAAPAPVLAANVCTLRGRCVDEAGHAIAGCLAKAGGSLVARDEAATTAAWQKPEPVTTGADGRFAFTFAPPSPISVWLMLAAPGLAEMRGNWRTVEPGRGIDVGDVVMAPGITLQVRVVDTDGSPCPDAQWHLKSELRDRDDDGGVTPVRYLSGRLDANGMGASPLRFAPGRYEARAEEGHRESEVQSLLLAREQPIAEVTIRMKGARLPSIKGRVVDDQGAPVRSAQLIYADHEMAMTTADGAFTLHRAPEDTSETTAVRVDARGFAPLDGTPPLAWGSTNVELRLRRGIGLTLAVTTADGAAVRDYTVRCIPTDSRVPVSDPSRVRARGPFEDGIAEVPGVAGGVWRIVLEFPAASGLPTWVDEVSLPANGGRVDVKVQVARRVVRVVTRPGEPVVATHVQLIEPPASGRWDGAIPVIQSTAHWLRCIGPHARLVCEAETDTDGRCEVLGRSGRTFIVRVLGPGHAPIAVESVSLDDANDLTVVVSRGARIFGRITPADAFAQLERYYDEKDERLRRGAGRPTLRLQANEGTRSFSTHTGEGEVESPRVVLGPDDSYEFVGQPAGSWNLVAEFLRTFSKGCSVQDSVKLGRIDLVDGQEVRLDLDLAWLLPTWLEAEVTWNGERFANGTIMLESSFQNVDGRWQGSNTFPLRTDASGAFHLMVRPGAFEVELKKDASGRETTPIRCPVPAIVAAGPKTSHTFEINSGRIELIVVDADGKPAEGLVVFVGDERCHLPATDAAGRAAGEVIVGSLALRLLPKDITKNLLGMHSLPRMSGGDPFAGKGTDLGTVAITRGSTTKHEVRLPPTFVK